MIKPACNPGSRVRYRANIKLSKEQDQELNSSLSPISEDTTLHGALTASRNDVRVVELFAGAGGMGVGFLMANDQTKGFRIINSAEINPIFLKSLETNYKYFYNNSHNRIEDSIPSDFIPIDLTKKHDCQLVHEAVKKADGVDIVNRNYPALLMTRLKGEVDPQGGWHGVPFWVPVIRFPDGNYAFSVNES